MSVRKISDVDRWMKGMCADPQHKPPQMISLPPGIYEHVCPTCGKSVQFRILGPVLEAALRRASPRGAASWQASGT